MIEQQPMRIMSPVVNVRKYCAERGFRLPAMLMRNGHRLDDCCLVVPVAIHSRTIQLKT